MTELASPYVPVSWGELLDKISILAIKRERIGGAEARANVAREHALLVEVAAPALRRPGVEPLFARLKAVNAALWEIEDAIRAEEAKGVFGPDFVALARAVYGRNDERAAIKRELNLLLGSELVEEKSYWISNPPPPGGGVSEADGGGGRLPTSI